MLVYWQICEWHNALIKDALIWVKIWCRGCTVRPEVAPGSPMIWATICLTCPLDVIPRLALLFVWSGIAMPVWKESPSTTSFMLSFVYFRPSAGRPWCGCDANSVPQHHVIPPMFGECQAMSWCRKSGAKCNAAPPMSGRLPRFLAPNERYKKCPFKSYCWTSKDTCGSTNLWVLGELHRMRRLCLGNHHFGC